MRNAKSAPMTMNLHHFAFGARTQEQFHAGAAAIFASAKTTANRTARNVIEVSIETYIRSTPRNAF